MLGTPSIFKISRSGQSQPRGSRSVPIFCDPLRQPAHPRLTRAPAPLGVLL